ncbi:hypothetical protein ACP179_20310 [Xenorhabdus stockiae]|uniref:hypothetical protein n=1 Tax=Xenorhabdus stockiae TaxID=351614 RepID=UPI003CF14C65
MRLMKAILLIFVTVVALPSVAVENKKYESMLNVSDDYYMDIRDGELYGIYEVPKPIDKDIDPWMGCTPPITKRVTVTLTLPDERNIKTFKVKYSDGDYETFDISPIHKDISNHARGYIRSLIKPDAKIKLTFRECGNGAIPTFVSAEK